MSDYTRSCGVLLPVFSLPSSYGIGTLGRSAFEFADFLRGAGHGWWQMLPVGPTGFGDSPYQSLSCFAGNPYLIDLDELIGAGLLTSGEAERCGGYGGAIDYGRLYEHKLSVLRLAFERAGEIPELAEFERRNAGWLPDFALYMALKTRFGGLAWQEWPEAVRRRDPWAMQRCRETMRDECRFHVFCQYVFFRQFAALRAHCRDIGLRLMGDIPMYCAPDSADVWQRQELFALDAQGRPAAVGGVPPDDFSEDGQLWGSPVYRWQIHERDGFAFWRQRVSHTSGLFDAVRLDHFRGFESFWCVPGGSTSAKSGRWMPGPGAALVDSLCDAAGDTLLIAEDLGVITPPVRELLRRSGMPGMAVLQFAFVPGVDSAYLPHNIGRSCLCCTGTHDNDTLAGWLHSLPPETLRHVRLYCGEGGRSVIRAGMASPASIFIAQMQDWLALDSSARINIPGSPAGNWRWRLEPGALDPEIQQIMRLYADTFSRAEPPLDKEDKNICL